MKKYNYATVATITSFLLINSVSVNADHHETKRTEIYDAHAATSSEKAQSGNDEHVSTSSHVHMIQTSSRDYIEYYAPDVASSVAQ